MNQEFLELYNSLRWNNTKRRIQIRDAEQCLVCGAKQYLCVHHDQYIGTHPSDTPDEYLRTLCHHCHRRIHDKDIVLETGFTKISDIVANLFENPV